MRYDRALIVEALRHYGSTKSDLAHYNRCAALANKVLPRRDSPAEATPSPTGGDASERPVRGRDVARAASTAPAPTPTTPPRDALATLEYLRARLEEAGRYEWVRRADLAIAALRAERTEHEARLAGCWSRETMGAVVRQNAEIVEGLRTELRAAQEKIETALIWLDGKTHKGDIEEARAILRGEGRPQERSSE